MMGKINPEQLGFKPLKRSQSVSHTNVGYKHVYICSSFHTSLAHQDEIIRADPQVVHEVTVSMVI